MSRYASIKKFYILGENIARLLLDETFFSLLFLRKKGKRRKNLRDKIRNERNNFLQLSKSLDSNREEPFSLKQRWREAGWFCDGGERFFPSRSEFLTRSSNMNRRERMVGIRGGCKIFAGCIAFSRGWAGRGG